MSPEPAAAEVVGVSRRFGANQALRDVSLSVAAGDSHALVGRNGAGKSTVVAVLTGLIAPDFGQVRLAGAPAPPLADRQGWQARVACVYQRSTVVPTLTVAENLFLNAHPTGRGGWVRWRALRLRAQEVLADWGLDIDVNRDAERLSVEQRQIVEIARALLRGTRFIILDEPTAELEGREIARLFARIRHLQRSGVSFLYISHHLEEIYEICRSVTVLRDGGVVASAPLADMPQARVVAAMVGDALRTAPVGVSPIGNGGPCLSLADLTVAQVGAISFTVAKGECVGLTGLAGSGKEAVAEAIVGLRRPRAGSVSVAGVALPPCDVAAAQRCGVGFVPRDRLTQGIIPLLSVAETLTMTIPERLGRAGIIRPARRTGAARAMIDALGIVAASPEQPIGELSGGNQQKALLGRALAADPTLLVLVQPTQGVDIASKQALFAIIAAARARGTGVLVVSDDLDELTICDRVLVLFKGRLTHCFAAGWQNRALVAAIEGVAPHG